MVPQGGRLTPEQLHAIFVTALDGRVQDPPSLEDCADLARWLVGEGPLDYSQEDREHPLDKVQAASIAFRNKLPEAEKYWQSGYEYARKSVTNDIDAARLRQTRDFINSKFAALRAALDECARLLEPHAKPYKIRWENNLEPLVIIFEMGMARTGTNQAFGRWHGSPLVVFIREASKAFGWSVSLDAIVKQLKRRNAGTIDSE